MIAAGFSAPLIDPIGLSSAGDCGSSRVAGLLEKVGSEPRDGVIGRGQLPVMAKRWVERWWVKLTPTPIDFPTASNEFDGGNHGH